MSSIKLSPNASGTGEFTIAAPNSNTNRTLSLPDQTGTVLTNAGPFTANASASVGAVTIDASNNVGIGTGSPARKLHVSASDCWISIQETASGNTGQWLVGTGSVNALRFYDAANGNERARIDSSGNFYVGKTTTSAATRGLSFSGTGSATFVDSQTGDGPQIQVSNIWSSVLNGYRFFSFRINASANEVGSISTNGSSTTSYNTSSDYRLKENIQPMTGALAKVALLKPCTYTWKADGSAGEGFIAHELQEVAPDAVTGEKDAVNEDGSIKPQGIDTSFLVATLTAAIQELNAKVEAQAAEIAALKGVQ